MDIEKSQEELFSEEQDRAKVVSGPRVYDARVGQPVDQIHGKVSRKRAKKLAAIELAVRYQNVLAKHRPNPVFPRSSRHFDGNKTTKARRDSGFTAMNSKTISDRLNLRDFDLGAKSKLR